MRRLLPLLVLGFSLVSLLIYLVGDSGLVARARLESYRRSLAANVEKLRARNDALTRELAELQQSPERAVVLARQIGLYRAGDQVVEIEPLSPRSRSYEVGDLLVLRKTRTDRNAIFKAAGLGVGAALTVAAFVLNRAARRKARGSHVG